MNGHNGEPGDRTSGRSFSRRAFLAAGAAGAALLASGCNLGTLATAQQPGGTRKDARDSAPNDVYRGSRVRVDRTRHPEKLYIDGRHIPTVRTSGAYLAVGFVFDPKENLEELGRAIVDARQALRDWGAKGVVLP